MKAYLLVGIGGMVGSMTRYLCSSYFNLWYPDARFPWGTFFVNILGCFLIGAIAGFTERLPNYNHEVRLLLITGLLGGFTTFSAFGIETVSLIKNGMPSLACAYAVGSVCLGIAGVFIGLRLAVN